MLLSTSSSNNSVSPSFRGLGLGNHGSVMTAICLAAAASAVYLVRQRRRTFESDTSSSATSSCIYLDYNGTTPIYPNVLQAMMPYLTSHYGNPSSGHHYGREPRRAIDQARVSLLKLLGCSPTSAILSTLWFTGCGTEADNLAIQLAIQSTPHITKKHIVTSNIEHPAIESYLQYMVTTGVLDDVTYVPVNAEGRVSAQDMIAAIRPANTVLVSLMTSNNEVGSVQPVQEVARACRERGVLMHTDAAQAAGKISVSLQDLGQPDMVSIVGHKIGAMKGVAALYVRDGCLSERGRNMSHNHGVMLIGGGQEFGRRGGTENTAAIVGFGAAADYAVKDLAANAQRMQRLRARLLSKLQTELGEQMIRVNGPRNPAHRLPNTLSVGFRDVHSGDLLADIGGSVAASAGATCHSAGSVSSVLRAMNIPEEFARGTVRLSLGPTTTTDDIDRAAAIISAGVRRQLEAKKGPALSQ